MSWRPAASAARTAAGGSVFVTATMPTVPASRPARRAAALTSARTAASRAASSSGKQPRLLERRAHLAERQPDDVGERPVHARDEAGTPALDRVRARFVQGLARRDVGFDGAGAEVVEEDARLDRAPVPRPAVRGEEREPGEDPVLAAREPPQ